VPWPWVSLLTLQHVRWQSMCRLAHGGHSQCEGADTKGGDAMWIVVGREWCLYYDELC
jgi:hypothetical protein